MMRFDQVGVFLVALFAILSLSQASGVLDLLDNPSVFQSRLNDAAFVRRNVACALDQGECDVFGTIIKGAIQEVITHQCVRCTPQQQANAERLSATLAQRYPREWSAVIAKYQLFRG